MKFKHRNLGQWGVPAIAAALTFAFLAGVHKSVGETPAIIAAIVVLVIVAIIFLSSRRKIH